jgi:hypothetical protein
VPKLVTQTIKLSGGRMQNQNETQEYEKPEVTDFGSLLDLTLAGHHTNSDVPNGTNPATAYAPGSPS